MAGPTPAGEIRAAQDAYDLAGVDPDIAPRLQAMVSPRRFRHCREVAVLAESLARSRGRDPDGARRAGLLHDVCRENRDDWPAAARREGLTLPDWADGRLAHLHGPLAAALARREFALPEAWCQAIFWHTTGRAGMTPEDLILFVADHAAVGRRDPRAPGWREEAHHDLGAVALEMTTERLQGLLLGGASLWLPTVEGHNWLLAARRIQGSGPGA